MMRRALIAAVLTVLATTAVAQTGNPSGGVHIELNKLEQVADACRAYLVTQNLTQTAFDSLKLDVVMFDNQGIVAKRLGVQIGPMPAGKTSLKVFDINDLACAKIGQLLLNNVLECTVTATPAADKQSGANAGTGASGGQADSQNASSSASAATQSRSDCLSLLSVSQRGKVPFIE